MATAPVDGSTGSSPRRPIIDARDTSTTAPPTDRSRDSAAEGPGDDLDVVRSVLGGDRDRFRVLVDRESGSVVRACFRILGDQHEAEDVAQEAFVSAYRALATWRGEGPFGAWLTRIAVRLAVRQLGKRKAVTWLRTPDDGRDETVATLRASSRTQPEQVALRAERASAARLAVARLDEPYREVVALRFFAERSLEEIASLTGRPIGTIKTHLRRGLLRLRDQIDPGSVA